MAVNVNLTTKQIDTDGPAGTFGMAYAGPSYYYRIHAGSVSPNASQIHSLALPPLAFSGDQNTYPLDIGMVDGSGNKLRMRNASTKGRTYIMPNGTTYILATSTGQLTQPVTLKLRVAGETNGQSNYIILDVTNNGASAMTLVPDMAIQLRLSNVRYYNAGNSTGDSYSWDSTNSILRLINSGISSIVAGFSVVGGPINYLVTDADTDELTPTVSGGNVGNTISGTATTSKFAYIQIGNYSNQTIIGAGATVRFTWVNTFDSSNSTMATRMATAITNAVSNIAIHDKLGANTISSSTPSQILDLIFQHEVATTAYMSNVNIEETFRHHIAGSYTFFTTFGRDGYYGALSSAQNGNSAAIKSDYLYMKSKQDVNHFNYQEIGTQVTSAGLIPIPPFRVGPPGDHDTYEILKGYLYYITTLDSAFLSSELGGMNTVADALINFYNIPNQTPQGLYTANGSTTYPDQSANVSDATIITEPVNTATLVYAFRRLAELNTVVGNTAKASTYTTFASSQATLLEAYMWNSSKNWPYMNMKQDGTLYNNDHLPKIDVLVFDVFTNTANISGMIGRLMASTANDYWAESLAGWQTYPPTDPLYVNGGYWTGSPWNIMDAKCFSVLLRYGDSTIMTELWRRLQLHLNRLANTNLGRPGERNADIGQFGFSSGGMMELVTRGLFGIDAHATGFTITPNLGKLMLGGAWSLNNIMMGGQRYSIMVTDNIGSISISVNGASVTSGQTIAYASTSSTNNTVPSIPNTPLISLDVS